MHSGILGPVAFLRFIVFIKDGTSLGSVGISKNVFSRGLSRKSDYFFICLYNFAFYFFSNCGKELNSIPSFKHILFVFMKIFLIMISPANFSEFVYNILVCFKLVLYDCFFFITSSSDEFSIEDILFLTDVIIPFVNHGFSINFCFFLNSFSIGAYVSRSVSIIGKN